MRSVDERPGRAKFRAVCWDDAEDVRGWLSALRSEVDELLAAARDRLRKKRKRVLSRFEARRKVRAAERAIAQLLEAGEAGLKSPVPPEGPVSPEGSSGRGVAPEEAAQDEGPLSERRTLLPPPGEE